jgi:hypothetical protein
MKLTDLNPNWVGAGGYGTTDSRNGTPIPVREGVGINFDCPCGCKTPVFIPFHNPLDGGPAYLPEGERPHWWRVGIAFEDLTLTPSIQRTLGCMWHGWITNGEIVNC